jgi:hypothetical protein
LLDPISFAIVESLVTFPKVMLQKLQIIRLSPAQGHKLTIVIGATIRLKIESKNQTLPYLFRADLFPYSMNQVSCLFLK